MSTKLSILLNSLHRGWLGLLLAIASHGAAAADTHELDGYVAEMMKQWSVPGMAVAVVKDNQLVFAKGFGLRQVNRSDRVDENTTFGIGSVTKSFTAAAAAMLVDDGKLTFDEPIIDSIKTLHFSDPWITAHATIRDLTSHRLGIDGPAAYTMISGNLDRTVEEARYIQPTAPFRTFLYSNTGYALLGKVIENASGESWDDFITERILKPLDMNHSSSSELQFIDRDKLALCWLCVPPAGTPVGVDALKDPRANAAVPHGLVTATEARDSPVRVEVLPWRSERAVASAGVIHSSVRDMAQWMILHLSGGEYHGRRLISSAQMMQIHSAQVLVPATDRHTVDEFKTAGYGMGWLVGTYHGFDASHHSGGRVGYGAEVWLFPDKNLGVVVLENLDYRDGVPLTEVALRFADFYLGVRVSKDAERHAQQHPTRTRMPVGGRHEECSMTSATFAATDLEHDTGTYRNDLLGEVRVVLENNRLSLTFEPQSIADLVPAAHQHFTACFRGYEQQPMPLRFIYAADGAVTGFVFGPDDPDASADTDGFAQHYFKRMR